MNPRKVYAIAGGLLLSCVFAVWCYWTTAPRTITWWEGTQWIMAAVTLGITFPPGSLLLTLIGCLVSKIPLGLSPAFQLNLFGGLIGIAVLVIIYRLSIAMASSHDRSSDRHVGLHPLPSMLTIVCGTLAFALGWTPWRYANKFNPYILTALMTGVFVWLIFRWWLHADNQRSTRWLALIMLCFGLDFSIHRTNLLLFPGFAVWVLLRDARTFLQLRIWSVALGSLLIGLSTQLGVMALARSDPILNANDPSNWTRFYEYVSLRQFGGGWLVNLWPRKGPFFSHQVTDYLNAFAATFADAKSPLGPLGLIPLALGLVGIATLWRRSARMAIGLVVLFLCVSLGAVIYFNLPENFPWPMDRHYLPSFVIFALFICVGANSMGWWLWRIRSRPPAPWKALIVLLLLLVPVNQWLRNHEIVDQSQDRFAFEFAGNILNSVEPAAIVIVQGDNVWPVWYRNRVEGLRPDVSVYSLSLLNAGWYARQAIERIPPLPVTMTAEELEALGPKPWTQGPIITLVVPLEARLSLARSGIAVADTVHLAAPKPVFDDNVLPQDWVLVSMISNNEWRRPIYFTDVPPWLASHCRNEGLVFRLIPNDSVAVDCTRLRKALMEDYEFSAFEGGTNGTGGSIRWMSQALAGRYLSAFETLATCENQSGNTDESEKAREYARELFHSNDNIRVAGSRDGKN